MPELNRRGTYVAPGQTVTPDGVVLGDPVECSSASFWVSGLASPFVTFGERAEKVVIAKASGEPGKIKTALNTGFGELFAPGGGDAPEIAEIKRLRLPYKSDEWPAGARLVTCGVDVQQDRLIYVIRAWGPKATSWRLEAREIFAPAGTPTIDESVWTKLGDLLRTPIHGHPINLMCLDTGYRPTGEEGFQFPENRCYEFARRFRSVVRPTKGKAVMSKILSKTKADSNRKGEAKKYGLELITVNTDYFKSWLHERIRWAHNEPGAWLLPMDANDDYCKQMTSEARMVGPGGKPVWVTRSRDNHYWDCEALNAVGANMLNAHLMQGDPQLDGDAVIEDARETAVPKPKLRPTTPSRNPPKTKRVPGATTGSKWAKLSAKMNR